MSITDHIADAQRFDRCELAAELEAATLPDRSLIVECTALKTGGCLIPNAPMGSWGPAEASVSLLGICGIGATLDAAIAQWIKCAIRSERAAMEEERAA